MMYLLFREKGWEPTKYWSMTPSEKLITRAFLVRQFEDQKKELEELEKRR